MIEHTRYFDYLRSRGRLGLLYRRMFLYPRLARYLPGRVLDVGCGIGDFVAFRPDTVGVDVNPHAVEWCLRQGLECKLMETDLLPFAGASFDGIVLDNVLEHLSDPGPLFAEIHRVLKSGGRLVVGVPGLRGYECDPDHKVFYGEVELRRVVESAGFSPHEIFHAPLKSDWLASRLPQYCVYGVFERI